MTVVYPFSLTDQELALKNAQWMNELGGCKGHEVVMMHDIRCSQSLIGSIHTELKKAFDLVHPIVCMAEIDGWPGGANYFFRMAAAKLETKPSTPYFFWMEPDAIPLASHWLDDIQREFETVARPMGKFFMGDRVQVENIPLHMSGVGIYPLPLHAYAGEAYRASEVAWDMAGKDQIVPKAHFTKLIEHAWKHPSFSSHAELATQIRKEAVLFHSSKDGSLIDLLRSASQDLGKETLASSGITVGNKKDREEPRSPSPKPQLTCDIFIRTYPSDYPWLHHCLTSIHKFCKGFRKIWIVSPQNWDEKAPLVTGGIPTEWKIMQDETPDGYLAQQITKMYADVITDYQPDLILHVDSDVIFTRPCTPESFLHSDDFLVGGKPVWYYTPYHLIDTPWQPITQKFLQKPVQFEFMRRFPIMVPRWLYPRIREFCHKTHSMIISDYIRNQSPRAFSEFNVMGAYAYQFHKSMIHFVDTTTIELDTPLARQFHSWGGITPEVEKELNQIFGGCETPPSAGKGAAGFEASRSLPEGIKELKNGLWVLENDTHISRWVEQQERLDHDQNSLPFILPLIKPGDIVVDAGAFIGDHTIAYAKAVGDKGTVYAFEPNPVAMKCLMRNLTGYTNVIEKQCALGSQDGISPLSGNNDNAAGAYLGSHQSIGDVKIVRLDDFDLDPDFIKFDIEGCEVDALVGAQKTIMRCRPDMVIEVNEGALERQGKTKQDLFTLLQVLGYEWKIMQENCSGTDPMYDIICTPKKSPEAPIRGNGVEALSRCADSPPPVTSSKPLFDMMSAILFLKTFANESANNRQRVMVNLSKNGLTPRNRNNRYVKTTPKTPVTTEVSDVTKAEGTHKQATGHRKRSTKGLVQTDKP